MRSFPPIPVTPWHIGESAQAEPECWSLTWPPNMKSNSLLTVIISICCGRHRTLQFLSGINNCSYSCISLAWWQHCRSCVSWDAMLFSTQGPELCLPEPHLHLEITRAGSQAGRWQDFQRENHQNDLTTIHQLWANTVLLWLHGSVQLWIRAVSVPWYNKTHTHSQCKWKSW